MKSISEVRPNGITAISNEPIGLIIGEGVMDNSLVDLVVADVLLEVLSLLNPFAKEEAVTRLQCGVVVVNVEDGVAVFAPMAVQTDKMTMLGRGRIDLDTEKINLEWITKPRKGIGISASMITNPYIKLGGTLADPSIEMKPLEAVTSTGIAVATGGAWVFISRPVPGCVRRYGVHGHAFTCAVEFGETVQARGESD